MKILLLAANPLDTDSLRLDKEAREIKESLQRSPHRQNVELETRWAVRSIDLQRALLEVKPTIVHFSGHGDADDGLMLEDEQGLAHCVPQQAVAGLFKLFAQDIQCVVLNACYSAIQAETINQYIPYVIGMNNKITDNAAVEFSRAFYDAVASGSTIEFAYQLGCNALHLLALGDEHLTPVLLQSPTAKPTPPKPVRSKADELRCEGLERRQRLLLEKLNRLEQSYDTETRVEEQMRMEKLIAETKQTLASVEEELALCV